jgi:hypothetical protein
VSFKLSPTVGEPGLYINSILAVIYVNKQVSETD